ncbi:right-handed parallel beta-helix repeat-containing protein [bacterium]|nr:right-handed parallel beta-helix repeat-containing protein [bacterium]
MKPAWFSNLCWAAALIALVALLQARPAMAADGQIDLLLDPTATTTINTSGSYILVDGVTMTADVPAITIAASDVTIDLHGFTLTGSGFSGNADGINITAVSSTVVRNGRIENFGDRGLELGANCRISDLEVSGNGGWGIYAASQAIIEDCIIEGNNKDGGDGGIKVSSTSQIRRCLLSSNYSSGNVVGIQAGLGAIISDCVVENHRNNSGTGTAYGVDVDGGVVENTRVSTVSSSLDSVIVVGIHTGDTTVVRNCQVNVVEVGGSLSEAIGIRAGQYTQITGNSVYGITAADYASTAIGIRADRAAVVRGNTVYQVLSDGTESTSIAACIYAYGNGCHIEENYCYLAWGYVTGGPTLGSFGIYAPSSVDDVSVIRNRTHSNATSGIQVSTNCYRAGNLTTDGAAGGTAGTVPGGADTNF